MIDLPGKAILDHHVKGKKKKLYVHDSFGPKVEMPVSLYFRNYNQMPKLEQLAIQHCVGTVLDVGAGAGSHILELQKKEFSCSALEISPSACEVMINRGVNYVIAQDFFTYQDDTFDTILFLMNGVGLASTLTGFRELLKKCKTLLKDNGKVIFDSCDISYMFEEMEKPQDHYYGELRCRYQYGEEKTDWFTWLYLDKVTMIKMASEEGWNVEILAEDDNHQYLACLTVTKKI